MDTHPTQRKPVPTSTTHSKTIKTAPRVAPGITIVPEGTPGLQPARAQPVEAQAAATAAVTEAVAKSDSRYTYIRADLLPSEGIFYPWQAEGLSIRRFNFADLKKIAQGQGAKDFRHIVEAVNATCDRDVFQMTGGDFWYLMYWHRIHSYLKNPLTAEFECGATGHRDRVFNPETPEHRKLPKASLKSILQLNSTTIQVNKIGDHQKIADKIKYIQTTYNGLLIYPARVTDLLENQDMMEKISGLEALEDEMKEAGVLDLTPEIALNVSRKGRESSGEIWLNDYASWLHPNKGYGTSLEERREFLEKFATDNDYGYDLFTDITEAMELCVHSITESLKGKCEVCGIEEEVDISTSVLRFFPELLDGRFT